MSFPRILPCLAFQGAIALGLLCGGCVKIPTTLSVSDTIPEGLVMLDRNNFTEMTAVKGRVAMVDFYSPYCGACRSMDSAVAHIGLRYKGEALIGKVNALEENELCSRLTVGVLPTIIFFQGGQEVRRVIEMHPEDTLAAIIDNLLDTAHLD
jgi:thioredoxin 1